jgi:hypothetical protein
MKMPLISSGVFHNDVIDSLFRQSTAGTYPCTGIEKA